MVNFFLGTTLQQNATYLETLCVVMANVFLEVGSVTAFQTVSTKVMKKVAVSLKNKLFFSTTSYLFSCVYFIFCESTICFTQLHEVS